MLAALKSDLSSAELHQPPPSYNMADLGDLEKFPPETRNEIYALALIQAEALTLCKFGGDQKRLGGPLAEAAVHRL
jgi:hypothetical protein